MRTYLVKGYNKLTGKKQTITVEAATTRHAKTVAYGRLTYPTVIRRNTYSKK